jgi:hypothetical protein
MKAAYSSGGNKRYGPATNSNVQRRWVFLWGPAKLLGGGFRGDTGRFRKIRFLQVVDYIKEQKECGMSEHVYWFSPA